MFIETKTPSHVEAHGSSAEIYTNIYKRKCHSLKRRRMKLESWRLTDTEIQERFSRGLDVISRARESFNNINPNLI